MHLLRQVHFLCQNIYNTIYILGRELVHVFAGGIILTCVDKAYIPRIAIAIFPKNKAANRDSRAAFVLYGALPDSHNS